MRQAEKVYLILLAVVAVLVIANVVGIHCLNLLLWSLGLVYIFGGYWLFRLPERLKYVSIVSGMAFGASLMVIPYGLRVQVSWFRALQFFTPNILLFFFLLFYLYRLTGKVWLGGYLKPLLLRSGVLVILAGFFVSSPLYYSRVHRRVIEAFNQRNVSLLHNLRMFDYGATAKEHLKYNNCAAAIKAANAARREGELWIEWKQGDSPDSLYSISGVLERQYDAYLCQGHKDYSAEDYAGALESYQQAHRVLDELAVLDTGWVLTKVWSWKRMAECQANLLEFDKSDSLYTSAVKLYVQEKGRYSEDLAEMLIGVSNNFTAQGFPSKADQFVERLLPGFEKRDKDGGDTNGAMVLYQHLVANSIRGGDFRKAKSYLEKGFKKATRDSLDYYKLLHYKGYFDLRTGKYKNAVKNFEAAKEGYAAVEDPLHGNHVVIRQGLFSACMALANYTKAEAYLQEALDLSEKVYGTNKVGYYKVLKDAALYDEQMGKYADAKDKLLQVLKHYERRWGKENNQLPAVLVSLASIESEMDEQSQAKAIVARAYKMAKDLPEYKTNSEDGVLLTMANVNLRLENFNLADSLYNEVLSRAKGEYNKDRKAEAMVGLAVLEIERRNMSEAERLLNEAMKNAREAFGATHPLLATLHYNKSRIRLIQNRREEALEEAEKAISITRKSFERPHPHNGDNASLMADIMISYNNAELAEKYYRDAEEIYKRMYKADHRKREYVKQRLEQIEGLKRKFI